MKLAITTLALLQTTDAHWRRHHYEPKPLEEFHCDYDKSGDMEHWEFLLNLKKTVWNSFIEGMYVDGIKNPVSEKCMGDWNYEKFDSLKSLHHKVVTGDFFNISADDHKKAANDLDDFIWTNLDECKVLVPITDAIEWCAGDTGRCYHKHGLLNRLVMNFPQIAMKLWEVHQIWHRDTLCENQTQKIEQIGHVVKDLVRVFALYEGIELTFDAQKELPKESVKDQLHAVHQKIYDEWPEKIECPFRPIFDAIHGVRDRMHAQADDFKDAVREVVASKSRQWHRQTSWSNYTPALPPFPSSNFFNPPHMQMPQMQSVEITMHNLHLF